jgi:hypothetical protein
MILFKWGLTVFFAVQTAFCCMGPSNIEGVAFTSGEQLNIANLRSIGVENVNYFSDSTTAIRYKSHYSNDAMVFIGNYGLEYQANMHLDCMGIILNQEKIPETLPITKTYFNFPLAVKTELLWLRQQTVISISDATIDSIYQSLDSSINGGAQYWTLQKKTLGYNQWFVKDSLNGSWGMSGTRSINGVKGCSSIKTEFALPSQQFPTTSVKASIVNVASSLRIRACGKSSIEVLLPGFYHDLVKVSLVGASGRICAVSVSKSNSQVVTIPLAGIATSGVYYVVAQYDKVQRSAPLMILK